MNIRLICPMFVLVSLTVHATLQQPVRTESGLVSGVLSQDGMVVSFKGIPYAAPPVGENRWRAPQPAAMWQGVRKADQFSASPVQNIVSNLPPWTYEFLTHNEVSEDCLYLNVWTPAKSVGKRLPVYVYIYGGAFQSGSGQVPIYDGEGLARKGIVVVTFNYRVGVLGFLAHPELTKESRHIASGNYGLLDQLAALRWVHQNIAAFGGDASRVTIAGQSAGSMSVHFLTASPLAKGLFQRAVAESGGSGMGASAGGPMMRLRTLTEAEADGVKFASMKEASSLSQLRSLTWQRLTEHVPGGSGVRFGPIVDYMAQSPFDTMVHGKLNDAVTLTGCNLGEIGGGLTGPGGRINAETFVNQAKQRYGDESEQFLKLYPAATDEQARASRAASSHDESLVSMYLWARKRAATTKTKTYIYLWDHTMPGPDAARYGAFHTSEVPYVMNTLSAPDRPFTEADKKIADTMSSYWANFAATGDPNGKGLPAWPAVGEKREVMEVGDRNAPVPLADDPAKVTFFEKFLSR